jgi:hypothetical protein
MTTEITTVSQLFSTPYLTVAEFKQAPTAVDVDDLVGNGSAAVNDQELANVIARASSWIDSYCGQVLGATTDTETFRARISRDGFLRLHPRYWPILEVVACSYGSNPTLMNTLDPTTAWIEQQAVVFPLTGIASSFLGSIQFSRVYSPTAEQFVSMTYVNGYANTTISSNVSQGATSLVVKDATGFIPGQQFMIYDADKTELCKVASTFVPVQGAGTVTLASGLAYAHSSTVNVSALPPAIKQAAIFMTSVILKARGNATLVMGTMTPSQFQELNPSAMNDYESAISLLEPYRRIR